MFIKASLHRHDWSFVPFPASPLLCRKAGRGNWNFQASIHSMFFLGSQPPSRGPPRVTSLEQKHPYQPGHFKGFGRLVSDSPITKEIKKILGALSQESGAETNVCVYIYMFLLIVSQLIISIKWYLGHSWCYCGQESAGHCRRHKFDPWSGKISRVTEQWSSSTITTEPWGPRLLSLRAANTEAQVFESLRSGSTATRSSCTSMKRSPHLPQMEKACTQKQRASATK